MIVLGAGSGGLAAAKRAAAHGARVVIIEGDRVGGTCVIRGCVPKKLLVYGSQYFDALATASGFGIKLGNVEMDIGVLLANVRKEVDRLNAIHVRNLAKSGVELVRGWGKFASSHKVSVLDTHTKDVVREINGDRILIAVGGRPTLLDIPGKELCWVSDDIFLQKTLPETVVIVGAGFIACEFASIMNSLGINVIQLVRGAHLLRGFDKDLSAELALEMLNRGIDLRFGQSPVDIKGSIGDLTLTTDLQETLKCGGVLLATGRHPFIEGLGLDNAGIKLNNNRITVNLGLATNIPNIYALGDVTNRINLTPVAIDEGRAFADANFAQRPRKVNYEIVPIAVFSQPEIATVGLSEEEAVERYGSNKIRVYRSQFKAMSQAFSNRSTKCLLKLVVELSTEKILGCHMFGEHASEIIQMAGIALVMGAKKKDFDLTMALHPTIAEEFVTMV